MIFTTGVVMCFFFFYFLKYSSQIACLQDKGANDQ